MDEMVLHFRKQEEKKNEQKSQQPTINSEQRTAREK
jgi:hypothetical protein